MAAGNVMRNGGQRYRKRRPLPAFLLILVLGIAATIVWLRIMNSDDDTAAFVHCDKPTTTPTVPAGQPKPTLGKALEPNALDRTKPALPGSVLVRVVNASSQRGQARLVTENLKGYGFTQVADPANDTLYGESMTCRSQIRFGTQGTAAARTLSLLEPCAELVRDGRQDATVDIALGEKFDDLDPNSAGKQLLEDLNDFAKQNPAQGGLQANAQPDLSPQLLTAARDTKC